MRVHPRLVVAAAACLALLGVGVVTWRVTTPDTYVAPTTGAADAPSDRARPAAAVVALADLQRAITRRDVTAVERLAPPDDATASSLLASVVQNAQALDLRDVVIRFIDSTGGGVDAEGRWSGTADVSWRIAGFDRGTARMEVPFTFRNVGDRGVAVESADPDQGTVPLWLQGPLQVRKAPDVLVMVSGTSQEARTYDRLAQRAVPVVEKVLPSSRVSLVVEVPSSAAALDAMLGADPGTYENVAAVTTSPDGVVSVGSPVHVFVNPDEMNRLKPTGAQVVMSHEATHAVTDAPLSQAPQWLVEGFADYVALRDVKLPLSTTAAQIIAQVKADGVPAALPGTAEFDTASTHLGAAYEAAWLACRLIARVAGQDALVRLYDKLASGGDVDATLRRVTGLSLAEVTGRWRTQLDRLAR
ncbi:hypothetical protein [Nocardioides acrostichi]|uniref:Peptidase MA superfamily protein n=1 Tax=Nocardioides acrostichi TaxID=2784339 RepID=A0A930UVT3_9ACTN|nr:hypothetical protein [Nocardioides acrostichi]MBF4160557.1 hypothetical protein [Nocardioides acrostichi]